MAKVAVTKGERSLGRARAGIEREAKPVGFSLFGEFFPFALRAVAKVPEVALG